MISSMDGQLKLTVKTSFGNTEYSRIHKVTYYIRNQSWAWLLGVPDASFAIQIVCRLFVCCLRFVV